jgi:chitin disaccharide deacetylase
MTKRLIVNADGMGFGPGATQGVLDAVNEGGFITSVSVNANFPEAARVAELPAHISVGVHLNPMVGPPCTTAPSLVDNGQFHGRRRDWDNAELEAELTAQVQRIQALTTVTHLDSHQNSHLSYLDVFLRVAAATGVRAMRTNASLICVESPSPAAARAKAYAKAPHVLAVHAYRRVQMARARRRGMRMAERLITVGYAGTGNKSSADNWRRLLANLPDGTSEVYCHPAYPDDVLRAHATYTAPRQAELDILRSTELRDLAAAHGVELVSFAALLED